MGNEQELQLLKQSMQSIDTFAQTGYMNEALQMVDALGKAYPDMRQELLWKKVELYNKADNEMQTLIFLIELYEVYRDEEAYTLIYDNYICKKDENMALYKKNTEWLQSSGRFFGECSEEPEWILIYASVQMLISLNPKKKLFRGCKKTRTELDALNNKIVFGEGVIFNDQIDEIAEVSCNKNGVNGDQNAFYLAFDEWEAEVFLQEDLLENKYADERFIFLIGEKGVRDCFSNISVAIPEKYVVIKHESQFIKIVEETNEKKYLEYDCTLKEIDEYYLDKNNIYEMEKRIREHKPRILFMTSRFTTVLQYHCKNSMEAAIDLGCECRLLIEKSNIQILSIFEIANEIKGFHPDVIFMLDHFRYESCSVFPDSIFFISWIQDPMSHIINPETRMKLLEKDIVLNHMFTWKTMEELYPGMLIDAPVPANEKIYRPYELTKEEKDRYAADICFVCHASDADKWINDTMNKLGVHGEIAEIFRSIMTEYLKMAERGEFFYCKDEFSDFIDKSYREHDYSINENGLELISDELYKWFNQRVFRQTIVDWIIDAGFTNLKLWGNGWQSNPKYAEYAMGPAENGETLSKIYQASKVVVGNNIMTTSAARAWESMLSGAFYLSNYIPPECDWCDIRKIMPEGTVEYFCTREELVEKLHYFIEHDDERKMVANKCREEALKRMTFKTLMEKVLNILPERL